MKNRFFLTLAILVSSVVSASEFSEMGVKRLSETQLTVQGSQPYLNAIEPLITGIDRQGRIVGGWAASMGQLPWQAALLVSVIPDNERAQFCGGTLISDTWVVTAAHCVDGGTTTAQVDILAGEISLRSTAAKRVSVKRIVVHSDYNPETMDNDIALIELTNAVSGEFVAPINPINMDEESSLDSNTPLVVSGWGAIYESGPSSPFLLGADVTLVDRDSCNSREMYNGGISEVMICAGKIPGGGVDSCQGDSGGPLVQIGTPTKLVSWGYGCARSTKPGVYTRVSSYLGWINSQLGI
jgi:secreted trypsin-like serine protease